MSQESRAAGLEVVHSETLQIVQQEDVGGHAEAGLRIVQQEVVHGSALRIVHQEDAGVASQPLHLTTPLLPQ